MKWILQTSHVPTSHAELVETMMENRAITDQETFLHPPQPAALSLESVAIDRAQTSAATERVAQAIAKQEKIVVFGDYDADGICSTAIMWQTLHFLGAKVIPFIPDRMKHGYGLSPVAITEILEQGKPDLVITVDNGIVAHPAVELLNQAGVEVLITDHHSPEATLPPAKQIVHTTKLCGATVAWMFCRELEKKLQNTTSFTVELLDLAGIATIADQVPLKDANRAFAYWGIEALKQTKRPGIIALCQVANLEQKSITTNSIHYGLAPRINAMGRLAHGLDALRLLCTTNLTRAYDLAHSISSTNQQRQTLTSDLLDHAVAQAETWETEHLIMVESTEYHEGIIGLIAGKLMETYSKPAIVLAVGEGKAKASARSIAGVNIIELLRLVKDDLLEVGGHPMAAGFGVLNEKIPVVKERLLALAKSQISVEALVPSLSLEAELPTTLLNSETIKTIQAFEPFGQGNPRPVWCFKNLKVLSVDQIGSQQQHLKLSVTPTTGSAAQQMQPFTALMWNAVSRQVKVEPNSIVDLAGEIESKTWKNRTTIQLIIKDVQLSED